MKKKGPTSDGKVREGHSEMRNQKMRRGLWGKTEKASWVERPAIAKARSRRKQVHRAEQKVLGACWVHRAVAGDERSAVA